MMKNIKYPFLFKTLLLTPLRTPSSSGILRRRWQNVFTLEILSCCSLIFYFGSMLHVVYKHERAARILAKQLRFNHRYFRKNEEKSAVKLMVIVIGLFLVCSACSLRCSLVYIMKDEQPCNDKRFKLPLLVLNSAINPVTYAFFKRDIKEEVERCICCVIWKKRNNIEPLNGSRLFPN